MPDLDEKNFDLELLAFAILQRDRSRRAASCGSYIDDGTKTIPRYAPEKHSEIKNLDPIQKRATNVEHLLSDPRAHPAD